MYLFITITMVFPGPFICEYEYLYEFYLICFYFLIFILIVSMPSGDETCTK